MFDRMANMQTRRGGRQPFNDGKTTEGMSVRWSPDMKARLRALAKERKTSVAIIVGEILEQAFERLEHK